MKNAKITHTMLGTEDHGIFTFMLHVDYDGSGQGIGGYALDEPRKGSDGKFIDTFGFALKSTLTKINGEEVFIFKDPATDKTKLKKSAKGGVVVLEHTDGSMYFEDEKTLKEIEEHNGNLLSTVFKDGVLTKEVTLSDIRKFMGFN